MTKFLPIALLTFSLVAYSQENSLPTQAIITAESKDAPRLTAEDLVLEVNNKKQPLMSLNPVIPTGTQIALLIDDGLRESVMRELNDLRTFVANLPPGVEIYIGYMSNGRVLQGSNFTTDHVTAATNLRPPFGAIGISASPYFCLSDFVKNWPKQGAMPKARFVLMLTNGVDLYNGSTGLANQTSPYVEAAQKDAQRAGVSVSSIYFADAGIRSNSSAFSGQSYLTQVADATGGHAYYTGIGNPVSTRPFLQQFIQALSESYVTTFSASGKDLVNFRVKSNVPHLKVKAPLMVKPGNFQPGHTE